MPRTSAWDGRCPHGERPPVPAVTPRWVRVRADYPRYTDQAGRPIVESHRSLSIRGFPRRRAVVTGVAMPWPAWCARTAQHRRMTRIMPPGGPL